MIGVSALRNRQGIDLVISMFGEILTVCYSIEFVEITRCLPDNSTVFVSKILLSQCISPLSLIVAFSYHEDSFFSDFFSMGMRYGLNESVPLHLSRLSGSSITLWVWRSKIWRIYRVNSSRVDSRVLDHSSWVGSSVLPVNMGSSSMLEVQVSSRHSRWIEKCSKKISPISLPSQRMDEAMSRVFLLW